MNKRIYEWMDIECVNDHIDGWKDGWLDGWVVGLIHEWIYGWLDDWLHGQKIGCFDE
jgi:hypothetical protein